jgi:hypothetical protein
MPRRVGTPVRARLFLSIVVLAAAKATGSAQVLEFWSNGLLYQALTRGDGLTLMYARLPMAIRQYGVLQAALNNGSSNYWKVKPTDFVFHPAQGPPIRAVPEGEVVNDLFRNAGRAEVVKLQSAYEQALFGNRHIRSVNGYEQRRMSALALGDKGIKAAAAASALVFVPTELGPKDSTDGALFFPNQGRPLGPGRLVAAIDGLHYEFDVN